MPVDHAAAPENSKIPDRVKSGACHALDVPFVFDNLADPSFATTGDPGWPAYNAPQRTARRFASTAASGHDPRRGLRTLWDGLR
ncbi:hypothetical protein ABZ923_36910 [Streptomyces sp. NPDC046881]|uniref:hypothetical protein n=1 Tax=Streptomyces sp. NPDC046881 TaxID=3155374 RepID=UPI0034070BA5